jgi:hypothetical protein
VTAREIKAAWEAWPDLDVTARMLRRGNGLLLLGSLEKWGNRGKLAVTVEDDAMSFDLAVMPTKRHGLGTAGLHHIAPFMEEWGLTRFTSRPMTRAGRAWTRGCGFDVIPGTADGCGGVQVELPLDCLTDA